MIKKGAIALIVLVMGMVCIAGCMSDPGEAPTLTPVPTETPVATTPQAPNLQPQPTDLIPTEKSVTAAASKDPITGDITVSFRGGKGQTHLTGLIEVVVISGTGVTTTKYMKPNTSDENNAVFTVENGEATKGEDRVMVTVSFVDGMSYKIYDDVLSRRN